MDSTVKNKSTIQAMTMAELLPGLNGICSKECTQPLSVKKQPRNTMTVTQTAVKVIQPMTIAEMQAGILGVNCTQSQTAKKQPRNTMALTRTTVKVAQPLTIAEIQAALKERTPRKPAQPAMSTNKKKWNSSVKVENKFRRTVNEQMKNNPVKKALNFQSIPKIQVNNRKTIVNTQTPKFWKPAPKVKKAVPPVRISGIGKIAETPISSRTNRVTIANKENYSVLSNLPKKHAPVTPKSILKQKLRPPIPDTPISNLSWKSSDTSFLQKEKEINEIEEKINAVTEDPTLENIAEVTPPVSTPFREYRNIQEFFENTNNVSITEDSALYNDNTIMSFENQQTNKENDKREESVIVSLCDMLNKASVNNTENINSEFKDLLESEVRMNDSIKTIDNCIKFLTRIKDSYLKRQQHIKKLIQDKQSEKSSEVCNAKTEMKVETNNNIPSEQSNVETSKPCSVIKSPTYKIPKKNLCLRKKVFHKSMPNISNPVQSPTVLDTSNIKAHNMYMKMKENMNFLTTPLKSRRNEVANTPAITSRNLQNQLDKLYNGS